jgi:hypothetical protein
VNGPDHHREAEHLIKLAHEAGIQRPRIPTPTRINIGGGPELPDIPDYGKLYTDEDSDPRCRNLLAEAQVHATLAMAAALQESRPDRTSRPKPASPDAPLTPEPPTAEIGGAYNDPQEHDSLAGQADRVPLAHPAQRGVVPQIPGTDSGSLMPDQLPPSPPWQHVPSTARGPNADTASRSGAQPPDTAPDAG